MVAKEDPSSSNDYWVHGRQGGSVVGEVGVAVVGLDVGVGVGVEGVGDDIGHGGRGESVGEVGVEVAGLGVDGVGVTGGRKEGGGIGPAVDESIGVGVDVGLGVDEDIGQVKNDHWVHGRQGGSVK